MAFIDLTENIYVEAVWFVSWPGGDWLCTVTRHGADEPWVIRSRFRHDVTGAKDRRVSDQFTGPDNTDETLRDAVERCRLYAKNLAYLSSGKIEEIEVRGGTDRFIKCLSGKPWFHVKLIQLPKESDSIH